MTPAVLLALLLTVPGTASAASFAGTKWRVVSVRGDKVPRSAGEYLDFTARRVKGYDGCNRFGARYRATATSLRFRNVVSTAIGCDGGPPSISGPVHRARGYRISGRRLELLGRRGRTLAVLKRR
jgi:heat shock protein HslJ